MKETASKVRIFGNSILRKKAVPVRTITNFHRDLLSKMAQVMYDAQGVGLAAPQIGVSEAIFVADIGSGLYKLINPRILKKEGTSVMEEGCLSVPDVGIKVKRAEKIVLEAQDDNGKAVRIEAEGLLARVFQHEMDHLKGKMIIDYASLWKRMRIKEKLGALKRVAKHEGLPESETKSCKL